MAIYRFPSDRAEERRFIADVTDALAGLRHLLEIGYELDALAADPMAVDDAETVVAILNLEVLEVRP